MPDGSLWTGSYHTSSPLLLLLLPRIVKYTSVFSSLTLGHCFTLVYTLVYS
ncbi:hypothetical protein HanIR_Chr04g0174051 [Helianthus annuus]|nr:hypothetical protein HanIR_Chr04g0174051 [Helianthus annuus]